MSEIQNPEPYGPASSVGGPPDKDARLWATLCHLGAFLHVLLPSLGNIIGPLVIWLLKRDKDPFIDENGKEALNFQICMSLYIWAATAIGLFTFWLCIGFVFFFAALALIVVDVIFAVIAAIRANEGVVYRYPLSFRIIS